MSDPKSGAVGPHGVAGPTGVQGMMGATGPTGASGPQAVSKPNLSSPYRGATGSVGPTGPSGPSPVDLQKSWTIDEFNASVRIRYNPGSEEVELVMTVPYDPDPGSNAANPGRSERILATHNGKCMEQGNGERMDAEGLGREFASSVAKIRSLGKKSTEDLKQSIEEHVGRAAGLPVWREIMDDSFKSHAAASVMLT
jgi:hypothetical protein